MIRSPLKKLSHLLPTKWISAAIGSALILLSTVVTGYLGYRNQNETDALRAEILQRVQQLDQSERASDFSSLISTLADIQDNTIEIIADPGVRAASEDRNDLTEIEAIRNLANAADKWKDLPSLPVLVTLMKQARTDLAAVNQLADLKRGLETDRFHLVERLHSEVAHREQRLPVLEQSRNRLVLIALVLQVTALVFLLLKELPSQARRNKSTKPDDR